MGKQDKFRFNLRFDETDEDHKRVCEFLNACGRKKARYVVKAILAYWSMNEESEFEKFQHAEEQKELQKAESDLVCPDGTYNMDLAEIELMRKNYAALEKLD